MTAVEAPGPCDLTARRLICKADPWSCAVEYLRARAWVPVMPGTPLRPIPVARLWKRPPPDAVLQLRMMMGDPT